MSQTSYSVNMAKAYEGGHGELTRVTGRRNNSGAAIPFGRFVVFDAGAGTTDLAAKLPAATTDVVVGVAMHDHSRELPTDGVPDDAMFNAVAQGQVWMTCETDMTPASPVFCRAVVAGATGTSPAAGKIRNDADTAKAIDMSGRARIIMGALAGGLCLVEVNLP